MTTFKVRTKDGAILGTTTATALPPSATGVSLRSGADTVTAATHWWNGSAFVGRTTRAPTTVTITPDAPTTITVPADAFTQVASGPVTQGPRAIQLAAGEDAVLTFTGKYAGTITAQARTLAQIEAALLEQVDDRREALMMVYMTPGGAKKTEYAEKAGEVRDYRNTLGSIIAALTVADRRRRFPWATAEADLTGEALAVVISRFETGAAASRTPASRIAAIAQIGKRAIKAATNAAAKNAAYAAINWKA